MRNIMVANTIIIITLCLIMFLYSLDIKTPFPRFVLLYFDNPMVRIIVYFAVYCISFYNPIIALLTMLIVITVHLDYINLSKPLKENGNEM